MTNPELFERTLKEQYEDLLANDPRYSRSAGCYTPAILAQRMTAGLAGPGITVSKDGDGVKRTCKILKIKYTYKAIREFLNA